MYWLLDRHQTISLPGLCPHYNIVDGDVDELDKEADEAHDTKANSSCNGNLGELLPVRLGAPLHQPDRVLGKLLQGFSCSGDLIHPCVLSSLSCRSESSNKRGLLSQLHLLSLLE